MRTPVERQVAAVVAVTVVMGTSILGEAGTRHKYHKEAHRSSLCNFVSFVVDTLLLKMNFIFKMPECYSDSSCCRSASMTSLQFPARWCARLRIFCTGTLSGLV